jgi:hypothetical protein
MIVLIVKPLEVPIELLQTEALNGRLPPEHHMKVTVSNDARILRAGYNGEKSLSFTLSLLDPSSYYILHNLRIPDQSGYFQIDNLLLNQYFGVILEVKNIFGTITFDAMGQMIRSVNEVEEGFQNPIEQAIKQEYRLRRWLEKNRLPNFPIERLVVFSYSSTILRDMTNDQSFPNLVIHEDKLFSKLTSLENFYQEASLTTRQVKRISKKLLEAHTPRKVNILEKYEVSEDELVKGVFCEKCKEAIMVWTHGKWKCVSCGYHSLKAHKAALKDYSLLISKEISNRKARDFLKLESIHVTKRLLQKEGYEQTGKTSARKYMLEFVNM